MKLIHPVLGLFLMATPALALEYACPTDPGFCYRDLANDGCFDSGADQCGNRAYLVCETVAAHKCLGQVR